MIEHDLEPSVEGMLEELAPFRVAESVYEVVEGVQVAIRPSRAGDSLYLMKVLTEPRCRGEGRATEALHALCEIADRHQATLFLEIEPFDSGGLSARDLAAWYHRLGFRGEPAEMVREPYRSER